MALRTAGSVLVVFLWSVAVVLGQNGWSVTYITQSICTLKGSSVELSCSYTYPSGTVSTTFWFTKKYALEKYVSLSDDPDYKGRVTYRKDEVNGHTLTIRDLRESDSAEYKFRFITDQTGGKYSGYPGVTLSVTGTVILYIVLICLNTLSVTVSETKWYTKGKLDEAPQILSPGYGGRVEYLGNMQSDSTLRFTDLREEDSAEYKFRFRTDQTNWEPTIPGTTLTVIGLQVKVTPATVTEGQKGDADLLSTTFSSEDAGRYSCAVEGHEDLPSNEETLTVRSSGQDYNITNIISEDRGEYYCEAQNGRGSMNSTALMIIVAGKQTSVMNAAVGIIVVVLVLILCLSGLMWFRKKASKSTSNTRDAADDGQGDSSPVYDNVSSMAMTPTAAQTADTDNQDYVHYASVHFSGSKNQEVPLYSTIQLPQPQIQEEDVQYAAVKFSCPSAATQ
ncbi:uncharacterized protein [Salmo salar]|uniref:Ig-like domain-containing protein n=1 Tax=Salmo salar TaxID=8030 RepID=A0ABM3C8U9_SALSA|nr:uncharacterized protein LOC106605908 [Salmo salar]